jgi:hypothetical protein
MVLYQHNETFEKCSILFKFKPPARGAYAPEGKANPPPNFGGLPPRTIFRTYGAGTNTWSILRIKLKLHCVQNVEFDPREIGFAFHRAGTEIGQKGAFCKGFILSPVVSRIY